MPNHELHVDFRDYACTKLNDHLSQIARCVRLLSRDQLWQRPNENSNAVGNLVLHLTGNVRQWIVGGVGGERINRDRQAEFDQREALDGARILNDLERTVQRARNVVMSLSAPRLGEMLKIQGYDVTVLAAVFNIVEHFAFHTGQIISATKAILDVDLSLYDQAGRRVDGRDSTVP